MARIFEITSDIVSTMRDAVDDLIDQLGKQCRLVYPPIFSACANCFTAGTMVSTPTGPQRIEKLRVGDLVYTHQLQEKPITHLFQRLYHGDLYNINCYGVNHEDWVTGNHNFPVIRNFKKQFSQKQWFDKNFILQNFKIEKVKAKDIHVGDAVLLPQTPVRTEGISSIFFPDYGEVEINDETLEFFGWWIAEGCYSQRSCCLCLRASREEEVADRMIEIVKKYFGVVGKKTFRKDADNLVVYFHSVNFSKFLANFGIGAKNKQIPQFLFDKLSHNQLEILLDAYHCGDGNICNSQKDSIYNRHSIATISKTLAYQIFSILHSLRYIPSIQMKNACVDKNGVNHKASYTVSWLPNRTQQKSGVRMTTLGFASVVSKIVTKHDIVAVYNIEVKDIHEYIANGIATDNCVYDPIGQKSSNRYLNGGPIPFDVGTCPMCGGTGQRAETVTETVSMILYWNPKDWVKIAPNVRLPDGGLQTKGYATDIPKIKRCIEMVAQVPMEGYIHMRYRLVGEPFDPYNIVPNRYFVANWERYA